MIPLLILCAVGGLMQAARTFTSDVSLGGTELAFGYMLLTAYFTAKVVNRFSLPKLTGYIIAGVVSGPFVLELVNSDMAASLRVVSGAATCILGLGAGAELDLKAIRPIMRTLRASTFYAVIGAMFVMSGAVFLLRPFIPLFKELPFDQSLVISILIGVALSAQSPSVVMALLSEMKSDGPLSKFSLAAVVVSDLVVILFYSIVAAIAGAVIGGSIDVGETALSVGWELIGSIVYGVVIGVLLGQFLLSVKQGASLFALMVCVVVAEIGSRVHLDPLVVMMAAGIWLRNFSRADASALLHGFESAELPVFLVFFALAGTKLNLGQMWAQIIPVLILATVRAGWMWFGNGVACARTRPDPNITRYGWMGLVPQAGLSLALITVIQSKFPGFGPPAGVLLLSIVGVNQIAAPVMFRIALIRSGEAGKKKGVDFAAH
jgi:Kef-type K+ transport system membrane component KefB